MVCSPWTETLIEAEQMRFSNDWSSIELIIPPLSSINNLFQNSKIIKMKPNVYVNDTFDMSTPGLYSAQLECPHLVYTLHSLNDPFDMSTPGLYSAQLE